MHIHTLRLDIPRSKRVICDGCDIPLRLASSDEAYFVRMMNEWNDDGPMVGPFRTVVVPANFSIFQEA